MHVVDLRYADDTSLCANSQDEAERLIIGKLNTTGTSKTTEIKCEKDQTSESWEDTVGCRSYSG